MPSDGVNISTPQAGVIALIFALMSGGAIAPNLMENPLENRVYTLELKVIRHEAREIIRELDSKETLTLEEARMLELKVLLVRNVSIELEG